MVGTGDRRTVVTYLVQNHQVSITRACRTSGFSKSQYYYQSKIIKTENILLPNSDNLLLIVDVKGNEFEVLKGINWNYPPRYLMLEDDQSKSDKLIYFLNKKNFFYLCGSTDKVFVNRKFM